MHNDVHGSSNHVVMLICITGMAASVKHYCGGRKGGLCTYCTGYSHSFNRKKILLTEDNCSRLGQLTFAFPSVLVEVQRHPSQFVNGTRLDRC